MIQKTRKLSIRMKILIPVSLMLLIVCLTLGISSYQRISDGMVEMGVEQADMAATVALEVIDGSLVEDVKEGSEGSGSYQALLEIMRDIQQKCGIAFLYTLYTDGQKVYYGVDTDDTENQNAAGAEFEVSYQELADVFQGKDYVQDYIDSTEDGELISVYKPIMDSSGKTVGVLGCDYDASEVVSKLNKTLHQVIWITVICLVVALALLNLLVNRIIRKLRMVDRKLYDLVHNKGDLTQKLDISTGDELELIANNVNALLEYIRGIMLHIADNSMQLTGASKDIVQNLSGAEMNITDVSSTMEEMSASMEETSASLTQINNSVVEIYRATEMISDQALERKNTSLQTMEKADRIHSEVQKEQQKAKQMARELAVSVHEKIEQSRQVEIINALTANILTITEETNLLSLNASIEAARAGEAGRGFSVVAGEIAKLAMNSAEAATEIQKVSNQVIETVNELAEKAEEILSFMDETAMHGYEQLLQTSLDYRNDVGEMNEMLQEFAHKSGELKDNIDSIKETIAAVNIAVEESAEGIVNVTDVSVNLTEKVGNIGGEANVNMDIANQLNTEVGRFKLQ